MALYIIYILMRLYNSNDNIELYVLKDVNFIDLIYSNSTLSKDDIIWLAGSSRGAINGSKVKNIGKLYLIFTKLLQLELRRPRSQSNKLYWNVPLSKFLLYVPNKNDISCIKRLLKASGVIDINERSSSGNRKLGYKPFPQSYRLNQKYLDCNLVRLYSLQTEQYYFLQKAYDNWGKLPSIKTEEEETELDILLTEEEGIVEDTPLFNWLHKCHRQVRIDMNKVERVLNEYLNHPDPKKRITKKEYSKAEHRADIINNFNSKHEVDDTFKRSKLVGRISNNINQLNKILRPALSYNNFDIHWVDIHACHPFLLLPLYNDIPQTKSVLKEKEEYFNLWVKGQKNFYLNFSNLGGKIGNVPMLKKMFLGKKGLYSRYRRIRKNYIDKVYSKSFPILNNRIEIIKTLEYLPKNDNYWEGYEERLNKKIAKTRAGNIKDKTDRPLPTEILYSQLAYINLRLESKLVIDTACKNFRDEQGEGAFALSMHDAVGVQLSRVRDIKRHLRKAFEGATGKRPKFG